MIRGVVLFVSIILALRMGRSAARKHSAKYNLGKKTPPIHHDGARQNVIKKQSTCLLIKQLTERLTAVEGEIEELKKPPPTEPPTNPPPLAPECRRYKALDSVDRKNTYNGANECDSDIPVEGAWYRFTGAVGSKMPESPRDPYMRGTIAAGWLNREHPAMCY
ncbi:hypothetical protein AWC38_SpisGene9046 [Stylophora pistillata]|uniref:Uncharacterized protein n=1 Tax=Stylophora pistillata TaxID=50429 RepID=A0A2B4SCG3_STYPI|nr:hypothetical protein AWC38_SpisGene9046 [Stylophora pistillata]